MLKKVFGNCGESPAMQQCDHKIQKSRQRNRTIRGEFRIDVREQADEVIVVADLPGMEKDAVSLQLINPRALEISCARKGEREEKEEGYYMRERVSGSMQRVVTLPAEVTGEDSKASFKNGVLEVHLKKTTISPVSRIEIE